jgi:two-component system, cell cycle sensor histidine kinase and response regulator CckA
MRPAFAHDFDGRSAERHPTRVSYILILAALGSYVFVGLISLYFHDGKTAWTMCGGGMTLVVPFLLLRSGRIRVGNLVLMIIVIATVTVIATVGQGIRDLAVVAYPIIFIYVGLTSDRAMLGICCGLTFVGLLWLAFGESVGWFVTAPLSSDPFHLFYLAVLSVLLAIAALAVDLLASNMRKGLEQAYQEIEERKRSEIALRASEAKFRAVVENSHDGIVFCDADARMHYRSPSFARITGYTDQETIGHVGFESMHPDDVYGARRAWATILSQPASSHKLEYRVRHKDGTWRWIEASAQSLLEQPEIQSVLVVSRDITARKETETALRASEERFRTMFERHSAAMLVVDPDGGSILDANRAAATFYGWPIDALRQMSIQQINMMPAQEVASEMQRARSFAQARFEFRHRLADGSVRDVEVHSSNIEYGGKTVLYSVIHDTSERKRAEELLRRGEERYRLVFETAPLAIIITRGLDIIYANPTFLKMLGFSGLDELKKYPPLGTFAPESQERIRENIERRAKGFFVPDSYETQCLRKDGTRVPVLLYLAQADFADGPATVTFLVDISAHKRAEEEERNLRLQLEQSQKVESIGRLAGGVAHDFNNMLMVILGHADIGLHLVEPTSPLHAGLTEIRKAAERSAELTRRLLAFARKQTVSPKVLDLNVVVQGMLGMLKRLIGENIRLRWEAGAGLWSVNMDPSQVDQVLANLCVNARDAIEDVGTISIETRNSILDERFCADHPGSVPGKYVLLELSDDGSGMDNETQSHLFEPFFTTKPLGQGTGLGLATVYGSVKQNNGFITFKSDKGVGTVFSIYLPRFVAEDEEAGPGGTGPAAGGHETVLVVEDEPANLALMASMLESRGYTVLVAGTPEEAIRIGKERATEIELLVTDVVMPDMNGRDLAMRLRTLSPDLKTLFMSGYTADVIATHGVLDKGVFFLQKPFSGHDLAAKVREVLQSGR